MTLFFCDLSHLELGLMHSTRLAGTAVTLSLLPSVSKIKISASFPYLKLECEINWKLKITVVLSERVRGSIYRSESGKMQNLTTTPPWLAVLFGVVFDIYQTADFAVLYKSICSRALMVNYQLVTNLSKFATPLNL